MQILIVNPNTSVEVTRRIAEAAGGVARPEDRFTTVPAAFGPALIVTPEDARRAAEGVVATVRAHQGPVDGIVLASFGDTGADAVRALCPGTPVVGIAGAAFAAARAMGGRFGIATFADPLVPGLRQMAAAHGMEDRLIDVISVPGEDAGDPGTAQFRHEDALHALARRLADRGAASVIFGGGPLAGLARRLDGRVPVPLIDGTQAAIGLLRGILGSR